MNISAPYIATAIILLAVLAILLVIAGRIRPVSRLSPLAALAFLCILAGIFFGDNRVLGYGLMGIGVLLAVIDIVMKLRKT